MLLNRQGSLGLALLDESRTVQQAVYVIRRKRLTVVFEETALESSHAWVHRAFRLPLMLPDEILIGHFTDRGGLKADPVREYYVPLCVTRC